MSIHHHTTALDDANSVSPLPFSHCVIEDIMSLAHLLNLYTFVSVFAWDSVLDVHLSGYNIL